MTELDTTPTPQPQPEPKKDPVSPHGKNLRKDFTRFAVSMRHFLSDLLSITEGTDKEGTITGIKRDVEFKGVHVWILIFSIFIASIGLNVNSTAVIIGAMLISPLMGPILGIGMAVGINDWQFLLRALKNLGIAVTVALVTSTLYFAVSPLREAQSELLARTSPTPLDILVALFGGFAGIIAGSRREKTNVVPGVAIATALMPPLCTAGFGLATAQWEFFAGGFYLFCLNSIFIAMATLITVRYLHFPVKEFMDPKREKQVKRYLVVFVLMVMVPSGFIFYSVIQESYFQRKAELFIVENVNFQGSEIMEQKLTYNDSLCKIELFVLGDLITDREVKTLNEKLSNYGLEGSIWVKKTMVMVHQAKDLTEDKRDELALNVRTGVLEDIYRKNEEILKNREDQIHFLENELIRLRKDTLPMQDLEKELGIQYAQMDRFAYASVIECSFQGRQDTIPTFLVRWKEDDHPEDLLQTEDQLARYLKVRLKLDSVRVLGF